MPALPSHPVPPHDPDAAAVLALMGEWTAPDGMSIVEILRLGSAGPVPTDADIGGGDYVVTESRVPTLDGTGTVPALVCLPRDIDHLVAVVYWVHGGGMVSGSHRSGVIEMIDLVREHGAAVVSIGYRLAPEFPYPLPLDDCYAGIVWLQDHAAELGIDANRILLAGGSAGGGLAAALALLLRERPGPDLIGQLLEYPMLDDRNNTPSAVQLAEWATWNRLANEAGWEALLGAARGGADVSPYAAPARARDLSNLPPTFLEVGSTDLFRDEVADYAHKLWMAGGDCELHVWPGGFHGYESMAPLGALSQSTIATRRAWLRRRLGAPSPTSGVASR